MAPFSDDLFKALFQEAPSAILVVDGGGRIALANDQAGALFGWPAGELVGQLIEVLVPAAVRGAHPAYRAGFSRAPVRRPMGPDRELTALRRDGTEFPVEIGLAPIHTEQGAFVVASVADLSERRRAEARFRVAVEASPVGIALVDNRGVIMLVNRALEDLFGYAPGELGGRPLEVLVPARLRARHPEYRATYTRDPRPRAMGAGRDLFGVRKDGSEVAVEIGLAPIATDDGPFVLATVVDITERVRADDRFRAAVESSPTAMVMIDDEGRVALANSRAGEIFGYPEGALVGESLERLIPSRFRARHQEDHRRYLDAPMPRRMSGGRKLTALRRDGTEFPVEIGLNPLHTAEGRFTLASVLDITERKRAEERRELDAMEMKRANDELLRARRELEHSVAELERRNEELDEFAHAVSHDLKAPLRGISHLSSWILEDFAGDVSGQPGEWLQEIQGRVRAMDKMLDDLLSYSRAIRASAGLEWFEIAALVEESASLLDVPPGFSARFAGPAARLYAERTPLARVLNNLIDNALKHHDGERGEVVVTVADAGEGRVVFEVSDDGPGIPANLKERAFGLFRRLSQRTPGSGVGLAMVKRLVEGRGGTVEIGDNQPRGTIFRFTWPVRGVEWST
jgi:PAS domain S-box-containing protein